MQRKTNLPTRIPAAIEGDLSDGLTSQDHLTIMTAEVLAMMVKQHIIEARGHALQAELATLKLNQMLEPSTPPKRGRSRKVQP